MRQGNSLKSRTKAMACKDLDNIDSYNTQQVSSIIRRYQELRDIVEITSSQYERIGKRGIGCGKEDLLCTIIDIDQAVNSLSPQQRKVIKMIEQGYKCEEICWKIGISINTVKFHIRQGIHHLTTSLNA